MIDPIAEGPIPTHYVSARKWLADDALKALYGRAWRAGDWDAAQALIGELNRRDWWWGDQQFDGKKPGWYRRGRPERRTPIILWLILAVVALLVAAICGPMVVP